ncbi:MAG: hypothetical protein IPK80_33720 [Nannocystis sp.]|nr:hypothetical protein [Nannocystis sp.]
MHMRKHPATPLSLTLLLLAACTGDSVATVTDTDTSSTTDVDPTTTTTGVTTTTTGATTTSSTTTESTTEEPTTTTAADPVCGDGNVDPGEECDNGESNADDAACTSACKLATCGDGLILTDGEICDDGVNDGSYGGCNADCQALGPRCGDGEVQEDLEACDSEDPFEGCKTNCQRGLSCLDLLADKPILADGVYYIQPDGFPETFQVFCDMTTDGGGYSFFKASFGLEKTAVDAEAFCSGYKMQLFTPRSAAHLSSAFNIATTENVASKGGGNVISSVGFLDIVAIYPVQSGESCVGMPFNSLECPEWQAGDGGAFYINEEGIPGEPSKKNCAGCSMLYDWSMDGTLNGYQATNLKGGGRAQNFFCDFGDKTP